MRRLQHRTDRRGEVLAEAALITLVFFVLILGMIDLGIGVFRQNTLSQAARHGVRQAIVHGSLAPTGWDGGPWGPSTIEVFASASGSPMATAVGPMLVSCELEETKIRVEWLDGGNNVEQRVRVTITTPYRPILTALFGNPSITLTASSTMPIAH